jgi:diacylglycerol O-acyltransferase / wax synthase
MALSFAGKAIAGGHHPPATRFNSTVSPHRVFETRRFTLDEFREIRSLVDGTSVNDALLAVCGGGLRRYLEANDELPEESLCAIAPIWSRGAGDGKDSNKDVAWVSVPLGTHLADPVKRLAFVHHQTASSSVIQQAARARELLDLGQLAPASSLALTSKIMMRANLGLGRWAPLANCTITNVPGPTQPLYLCGARMTYFSAIMPISDGMGLSFAVTSYDGRIIVSPTSCRELIPDPEEFAQCLRDSFQEMLAVARRPRGRPARGAAKTAKTKVAGLSPRSRARSSSGAASPRTPPRGTDATALRAARAGRPRSTARSR